jgi:mannose-1-phosphate guanylyltransferase
MADQGIPKQVAVIMAGGVGERFWPLSRRHRPKQLLHLTSATQTLLAESVERISPVIPSQDTYIITGEPLQQAIQAADVGIPNDNVLAEPCKRNTTGALAWTAAALMARYGEDAKNIAMAVLTADHQIGEPEIFCRTVATALQAAHAENSLVTIGIAPRRPETGYGYIECQLDAVPMTGFDSEAPPVYPVQQFLEKPKTEIAEEFVASGRHYWNSGMFFWRISTFLESMQAGSPEIVEAVNSICELLSQQKFEQAEAVFASMQNISIDYALLEKAPSVLVVSGEFPWDDIGAWDAMDRLHTPDANNNIVIGEPVLIDSSNCIVYNEPGKERMAVSVIGAENLVVVVADDAVLVVPKDRAQEVRKAVDELNARSFSQI